MKNIQIETLVLGSMAVNCYLVMHRTTKKMVIIDPGAQPERVIDRRIRSYIRGMARQLTSATRNGIIRIKDNDYSTVKSRKFSI